MKLSSKDFQRIAGGDARAGYGLIRALQAANAIVVVDTERAPGRGRPRAVYEITGEMVKFIDELRNASCGVSG